MHEQDDAFGSTFGLAFLMGLVTKSAILLACRWSLVLFVAEGERPLQAGRSSGGP